MRRPYGEAGLREAGASGFGDRQRDPEIRYQRLAIVQQDVLGLDVPVHHVVAVGVVQRRRHAARHLHRLLDAQLLLVLQPLTQRLPLHVRHHVVEE
jgi:hypothetical protein